MTTLRPALLLAALLGACVQLPPTPDYELNHPIGVADAPQAVLVPPGGQTTADMAGFFAAYRQSGGTAPIAATLQAPDAATAARLRGDLDAALARAGLRPEAVAHAAPAVGPGRPASLSLAFALRRAVPPECNAVPWWGYEPLNWPSANFGCATQHNLAAMVEDANDFLVFRPLDPRDVQRGNLVIQKYRRGEWPGSQPNPNIGPTSTDVAE
ncbi:MAG TPA: CpaD family pilus assembly lipoprotein [Alphaproteobacteria bacterium]|nr:CpaD family pilus assembly lipoprotein [Alphaproteobacteria bacterium]